MKHISVFKSLEYLGYILIGVGITLAMTSCGDGDTLILSPDNVFKSSASSAAVNIRADRFHGERGY